MPCCTVLYRRLPHGGGYLGLRWSTPAGARWAAVTFDQGALNYPSLVRFGQHVPVGLLDAVAGLLEAAPVSGDYALVY